MRYCIEGAMYIRTYQASVCKFLVKKIRMYNCKPLKHYLSKYFAYLQPRHPDHRNHYFLVMKVTTRKEEERKRGMELVGRMAIQDRFWNRMPQRVVTMGTKSRSPQAWGRNNHRVSSGKTWISPSFLNHV